MQTFPDDESVVSVLAKLETGDDKERADKAAARLGACGLSSVPSWLRPHKALSNGEAARVEVATCLARQAASQKQFCVVNDFACVVNRDAARSMACAVGKYARRLRMAGLVLATAHDDVCAYLQPDWCYDVAADALYLRPTEKPQRPKVSFACDWTHGGLPNARDRRKNRETDLVREITASYSIGPRPSKVVLGTASCPGYKCQAGRRRAKPRRRRSTEFDGGCVFSPPDFQDQGRVVHRRRPRAGGSRTRSPPTASKVWRRARSRRGSPTGI